MREGTGPFGEGFGCDAEARGSYSSRFGVAGARLLFVRALA